MDPALAYTIAGALLIFTAVLAGRIRALPLTTTIVYLLVGIVLGPLGISALTVDVLGRAKLLELVAELAVIVSLFSAGLKMRVPITLKQWWVPLRLAFGSMVITVALIAAIGVWLFGLPLGAAVLLGAILAPTDPVLASDVQLAHPHDDDELRFRITAEAGLNDGTAFSFVMLGLGLLGLHEIGEGGWKWFAVDVVWAIPAGLAIGAVMGTLVGKLILHLRRKQQEALGRDEFIALGLLTSTYGLALLAHSYGFLAAFTAGVAIRVVERRSSSDTPAPDLSAAAMAGKQEEIATDDRIAPAYMAAAVLQFNEQLERLLEVLLVLLVGAALTWGMLSWSTASFVLLLLFVVRPAAVYLGLVRVGAPIPERRLLAWFGIRGIGSIYYLMYAVNHGVPTWISEQLITITMATIVASVFLHGISVTPLMNLYEKRLAETKK